MSAIYDSFARLYEADFANYDDDLHFISELARRTGGPIMELMCGAGRVLLPLAEEGYTVTGVDLSDDMLDLARQRAAEAGLQDQVTLLKADIRKDALPRGFMLVFITANSFMHMETVADQLAALATIRPTLRRDGLLVLDLFSPNPQEMLQNDGHMRLVNAFDLDGERVVKFVATTTDIADQTDHVTFIYEAMDAEGRVARRVLPLILRWLYRFELEHLLVRAGYELEAIFGSYNLDEYTGSSERIIAVAHVK